MHALVTGATGFVGRNLCAHLVDEGWNVTALHRATSSNNSLSKLTDSGVNTRSFAEFTDLSNIVDSVQPDVVFHLAAHFDRSPQRSNLKAFVDANVTFGTFLLDSLQGSSTVVVNTASYFQFRAGEPEPNSLYAATKQAFLEVARFYRDQRFLDIRTVVLNDNYGPDDTRDKLVNELATAARSGAQVALGHSQQWINLIHIRDLVRGLLAASAVGEPDFMSIRAADNVTVGSLVEIVDAAIDGTFPVTFDHEREPDERVLEPGSWPSPTGWSPNVTLEEGLRDLLH